MTGAPGIESSENADTSSEPYRTTETSELRGIAVRTWPECMSDHSNRQRSVTLEPFAVISLAQPRPAKSLCRIFVLPFEPTEVLLALFLV